MATTLLRISLILLGMSAIGIGLGIFFTGPNATAQFFVGLLTFIVPDVPKLDGLNSPNADSEFRFFSVFWFAYGVGLIAVTKGALLISKRVPILLGLFFLGGVGRLLSYSAFGAPHLLFISLMAIELALPIVMLGLWLIARRPVLN